MLTRSPPPQAGNSLPGRHFPAAQETQVRKGVSPRTGVDKVSRSPRAARNRALLPVPQAMSRAGPDGRSGKSSGTILAGSAGSSPVASLCLASQSVWLEGIKKAPELAAQEPVEKSESARGASLLAIKR